MREGKREGGERKRHKERENADDANNDDIERGRRDSRSERETMHWEWPTESRKAWFISQLVFSRPER